ncbi:MAG TPA: S53 family peptidase [Ktedonobacteraceae bacterium]|nr:S53 family peptidase [Ktedonobacteraceae bacterium]
MRSFSSLRTLIIPFILIVMVLSVAFGAVYLHGSVANAASPTIKAHAIKVSPKVATAGTPDHTGTFPCQNPTYTIHCYGPKQIRAAYSIQPLLNKGINGWGRTIVIVDAFQSPTIRQDLNTFNKTFGIPPSTLNIIAPDGLTPFDPTNADQVGWAVEISLDVQWSHAIAPNATIDLVLAKSDQDVDILSATRYAVDQNLGDVISQSFGENESCVDPQLLVQEHKVFQEATDKHITLLASSGDSGAAQLTCDGTSYVKAVSSPASDPLVTGVGGTQLFANQKTGQYISEIAWNEPQFNAASGGGYSVLYSRPSYQNGTVNNKGRGVPDVAYNAAVNGGVLVAISVLPPGAEGFPFHIVGGTSAGSPQWAGIVALANQIAGERLGFLNQAIYGIGRSSSYSSSFHDILFGNNTVQLPNASGTIVTIIGFSARKGWDPVTGWGSPIVSNLVWGLLNAR